MEKLKPIAITANRVLDTVALQQKSAPANLPACRVDLTNLPALLNKKADYEIPRRVYSHFKIDGEPRTIQRSLTIEERATIERRIKELEPAFIGCTRAQDEDEITLALLDMFGGFPGAKGSDAEIVGKIDSIMRMLMPDHHNVADEEETNFPLWAIVKTCRRIRMEGYEVIDKDGSHQERHWPPSDGEIVSEIRKTMKIRLEALESARALLTAEVER